MSVTTESNLFEIYFFEAYSKHIFPCHYNDTITLWRYKTRPNFLLKSTSVRWLSDKQYSLDTSAHLHLLKTLNKTIFIKCYVFIIFHNLLAHFINYIPNQFCNIMDIFNNSIIYKNNGITTQITLEKIGFLNEYAILMKIR